MLLSLTSIDCLTVTISVCLTWNVWLSMSLYLLCSALLMLYTHHQITCIHEKRSINVIMFIETKLEPLIYSVFIIASVFCLERSASRTNVSVCTRTATHINRVHHDDALKFDADKNINQKPKWMCKTLWNSSVFYYGKSEDTHTHTHDKLWEPSEIQTVSNGQITYLIASDSRTQNYSK